MNQTPAFLLASTSPRRQELALSLGIPFRVVENPWVEVSRAGESPRRQAQRLSQEKLQFFLQTHAENQLPVLTADTLISFRGKALNKPESADEAWEWYRQMAGRYHFVLTALSLGLPGAKNRYKTVVTRVKFLAWSEELYRSYLATGEWEGAAGGYRIQETGTRLIDKIEGSWSNVVGLPLAEVYGMIRYLQFPGRQ